MVYSIERYERMGRALLTFFRNELPLGSMILDPETEDFIIKDIYGSIERWNLSYNEREEKENSRRNAKKRNRNAGEAGE